MQRLRVAGCIDIIFGLPQRTAQFLFAVLVWSGCGRASIHLLPTGSTSKFLADLVLVVKVLLLSVVLPWLFASLAVGISLTYFPVIAFCILC